MHSIVNRFYPHSLKTAPSILAVLLLLGFNCLAVMPTNPAPVVSLLWDPSTGPNVTVTNYFIYYGTASRQYTTKIPVGNVTNTTIQLPQRGVTFYFGATAQDTNALESEFSNEVTYGAPPLPPAPNLKPPVRVIAQTAPSVTSPQWADFAEVTLGATQPEQVFRLKIVEPEKPLIAANTSPRPARSLDLTPPPLPK